MKRLQIFFATSNAHKVKEINFFLRGSYPIEAKHLNYKGFEIQAEHVEDIAKRSAIQAVRVHKIPLFVEDTGLFIKALKGFPGSYARYVNDTIGIRGILKLLEGGEKHEKSIYFQPHLCNHSHPDTDYNSSCIKR